MKKVLLITYYWPPAGGAGVQRPLKFVKYLRDFGWEPIVYTCDISNHQVKTDETLLKDLPQDLKIYKKKLWEPYSLFFKIKKENPNPNGFKAFQNGGLLSKILLYIRSNFFFPDAKMFWIYPSVTEIKKIIKKENIDAIISTGPPHTTHMIALKIKKETQLPWIADFRDPWTNIEYFSDLKLFSFVRKLHYKFEKEVTQLADKVIVVGKTMQEEYRTISSRKDIEVITNGYDENDFESAETPQIKPKFNLNHTGTLRDTQNHESFWKALQELCSEVSEFKKDLEINFYGFTDSSVLDSAQKYDLQQNVQIHSYLNHSEIVKIQKSSLILLLIVNKLDNPRRIITGKIFEYIASERPILLLGPEDGDAAEILEKVGHKHISDFDNKEKIKAQILDLYNSYQNENLGNLKINSNQYSRKELTKELSKVLNSISPN